MWSKFSFRWISTEKLLVQRSSVWECLCVDRTVYLWMMNGCIVGNWKVWRYSFLGSGCCITAKLYRKVRSTAIIFTAAMNSFDADRTIGVWLTCGAVFFFCGMLLIGCLFFFILPLFTFLLLFHGFFFQHRITLDVFARLRDCSYYNNNFKNLHKVLLKSGKNGWFLNFNISPKSSSCSMEFSKTYYGNVEYHPRYACRNAGLQLL